MADSTRFAQATKEMEDRISQRMDNRFMELVTTLKETLTLSMKDTIQDLLTLSRGERSPGPSHDTMSRGPRTGSSYVLARGWHASTFPDSMAKMLTSGFINAKIIFSLTRLQRNSRYSCHLCI